MTIDKQKLDQFIAEKCTAQGSEIELKFDLLSKALQQQNSQTITVEISRKPDAGEHNVSPKTDAVQTDEKDEPEPLEVSEIKLSQMSELRFEFT